MVVTYNYDKFPRSLFGKTFNEFNFEIIGGRPVSLTVGDIENEMVCITGLEEIARYRMNNLCSSKRMEYGYGLSPWYGSMLVKKKDEIIMRYEEKIKNIRKECAEEIDILNKRHAAELFDIFLSSITVNPHPLNKPDISFASVYYGIDIKVAGSETTNLDNTEGAVENAGI